MTNANSGSNDPSGGERARDEQVQTLYESLPYPSRDPDDEKRRLVRTSLDFIPKISHFCFSGTLDVTKPARMLVAGGGTGDSMIYLAEQLRDTTCEIVHLDISTASLDIARRRAEVRNLDNIRFVHGSILDIAALDLPRFDYINCAGVLHHLERPEDGLAALAGSLAEGGALGLMVYARYGRTAVYQMQELMQRVSGDQPQPARVELTWKMLDALPKTNWLARSPELHTDHKRYGDAGLADLFLNPRDRAYTVPELYQWLDAAGMQMIDFADDRMSYDPALYIADPDLRQAVSTKSLVEQQAIAELMSGAIIKHTFYAASVRPEPARLTDATILVPAFELDLPRIAADLKSMPTGSTRPIEKPGARIRMPVNPISVGFFAHIHRGLPFNKLVEAIADQPELAGAPPDWMRDQVTPLCELLVKVDMLYYNQHPCPGL